MIVKPNKWVSVPDESGCGILEATVYGESAALPIPIETQDILSEDITFGEEQDFELIFERTHRMFIRTKKSMKILSSIPPWRQNQ